MPVTAIVWPDGMDAVPMPKNVLFAPAGTVTEAGRLVPAGLGAPAIDTATRPVGATADKVTVQVTPDHGPTLAGQETAVSVIPALYTSGMEVVADDPVNDAVSVAAPLAAMVPAVAVNVALVEPAGTVTDAGTVT